MNMQKKIVERYPFGKAALNKLGEVPDNFRLYRAGWDDNRDFMTVYGAEFKADAQGFLSKKVEGTEKKVVVSVEEINEFSEETKC